MRFQKYIIHILLLSSLLAFSGSLKAETDILSVNQTFFKQNAKRKNIRTTPSGLQYKIIRKGKGKTIQFGDEVYVKYKGKLLNGKVFDEGKINLTLQEGVVIQGWTEGLQLMQRGGKYTLYVPADLAYGEMSPTPDIPDNAALIFDIEILTK